MPSRSVPPRLSVIVPTYGRPERVANLLVRLDAQTLDAADFEVIFVDDGTPEPIRVDATAHAFELRVLRQDNAGPGAARNLGVEHARAPLVIFLNDDAVPANDLLAVHVAAHAKGLDKIAVMGSFPFTRNALKEPFTQLLADSDLLFDFPGLRDDQLHPWGFFWTCNISLPRAALLEVGGFDARTFKEAIVEDVELGYRLEQRGWRVLYRADARCEHEHALTVDHYFRRAQRLGVNLARMWRKHQDARILWQPRGSKIDREYFRVQQLRIEKYRDSADRFVETMRRLSTEVGANGLPAEERARLQQLVRTISYVPFARGVLSELTGTDPIRVMENGIDPDRSVSIIACSYNALKKTQNCVDSLRRTLDHKRKVEILFVDNGSTDGSAEWLTEQRDVATICNADNRGAPRARNQALKRATGDYVVFIDNDIVLTPGWLERLIFHAEVDSQTGIVGACADRASHGQEISYEGACDFESLAAFARSHAEANHQKFRRVMTLASFCVLAKREVIDRIGGFDESFSPWGFEDDDFTLRAYAAGWWNRIALDVFVHHDTYVGPKLERHTKLLEQNWRLFASKWGLGDAPYGRMSGLSEVSKRTWTHEELYCALPEDHAPLPAREIPVATRERTKHDAKRKNSGRSITLCMIARDEEEMIGGCLDSVAAAVDALIVVDTGSSDRTRDIALERGAKVIDHVWDDDFSAARNAALAHVDDGFVLVLDADERLAPGAARALREAVARDDFDCGMLPLHNALTLTTSIQDAVSGQRRGEIVLLPRLLRRTNDLKWQACVHENVDEWVTDGKRRVARVDADVVHYGNVPSLRARRGKDERNRRLLETRVQREPGDPVARTFLARELERAGDHAGAAREIERAWNDLMHARARGAKLDVVAASTLHAFLLLKSKQLDEAGHVLGRALAVESKHPNLNLLYGVLAEQLAMSESDSARCDARLHEAERAYDACLAARGRHFTSELLPGATSWAATMRLGFVRLLQGREAQARTCFESVLRERPGHVEAVLGVLEARILTGDARGALTELEARLADATPDAWILGALACVRIGRLADASAMTIVASERMRTHEPLAVHRADMLKEIVALATDRQPALLPSDAPAATGEAR